VSDRAPLPRPDEAPRSLRDLVLIGGVLVALFGLGAVLGLFERLSDWLVSREHSGGAFALVALIAGGAAVFSVLRWRQAVVETRRRIEVQTQYRLLVEQAPAVIHTWDITRPVGELPPLYISPQVERMFGHPVEDWMRQPDMWTRLIHPADRARVIEAANEADSTGTPFDMEYRAVHRDGRVLWIHDEQHVVSWDVNGSPLVAQGVFIDITRIKQAEERLSQAEVRFRSLVEQIPAITYLDQYRPDAVDIWPTTYMSPQVEEILGYSPDEWNTNPAFWAELVHPDDRERYHEANEHHYRTGEPLDFTVRVFARDGTTHWIRDRAVIIEGPDGTARWAQGILFDETERVVDGEHLRAAEERFRAIVEHIPAAVYLDVPDGSMESVYVSPQVQEIMGVSVERYLDEPELWLELMDEEDRRRCERAYLDAVAMRRSWAGQYRIRKPDGKLAWIHDETTFLTDAEGNPLFLLGVLYDVTERKRAEEALLESERRERDAAERLRALDDMKNTFLAAVSHELRSPLTSILGLSLTLERTTDLATEDRHDLVARLSANAQKLDRLLRDLLDIDRLNRGIVEPQLRVCDVGSLASGTLRAMEITPERRVAVETEGVELEVDAAKVERIVENLLTNAIRHTPAGGTIWLSVRAHDNGALIVVEDDGPGVPPDLRTTIFEPFRQGPARSSQTPGTGIGLSLVGRFAELHGGRAWVEDRPGGGASFRVFLPGSMASDETDFTAFADVDVG
jgi:PAS domain S-box-containing protein